MLSYNVYVIYLLLSKLIIDLILFAYAEIHLLLVIETQAEF